MKCSVVIATYNGEKYLYDQLFSIYNQTVKPDEVIIVDDCSNDGSVKILNDFVEKYKLDNWFVCVNEINRGFIDNFNHGLSKATGEIIFLCDQDDIWNNNKIEIMKKIMSDNKEILSLSSSFSILQNNSKKSIKLKKGKSNNNLLDFKIGKKELFNVPLDYLTKKNFAQGCSTVIRKKLKDEYLNVNIELKNELVHDWALLLIASINKQCFYYNDELFQYRIHNDNAIGLDGIDESELINSVKRIKDRSALILEENARLDLILYFTKSNSIFYNKYRTQKEFNILRSNAVKEKKMNALIKIYLNAKFKDGRKVRAFIGDFLSITK